MQNAIAFANNDVITIAWSYGHKLPGCMGFAVYRVDAAGTETPLPAVAVFPGMQRRKGQTTADCPIQKFYWKDVYARLEAEKTGKRSYRYRVVPLQGKPGHLVPMNVPQVISNAVEITPVLSQDLSAFFNRGLISTQRVSRAFKGKPAKGALLERIAKQIDPLRKSLSGDMIGALTGFLGRAKKSGSIYAALYELGDEQLIKALEALGERLHVVLSNPKATDAETGKNTDGNKKSRARLAKTAGELYNRMLPNNQIGHNKFLVYVNAQKKPVAVLFGSTNWTSTGLCAQTNNTVVVDDAPLAARYLAYWKKLAADTKSAGKNPKALQAAPLRTADATSKHFKLTGDGGWTSWFSPNTPKLRGSNKDKEKRPPDMEEVAGLIAGAKQGVLFLAFYPGSPSIADWAAQAQKQDKTLFVRGCVTHPSAAESFYYDLHGMTPPKKKKGVKAPPGKQDARVIAAKALDAKSAPPGWLREILNAGFAITHDKIVVVDPFSDASAVVTGSHNLGHKASFNNDENLAIVRGNRKLAQAYATHVLDVYDHFAWRFMVETKGQKKADQSLKLDPEAWQGKYFDAQGKVKVAQLRFWLSALP